MKKHYFLFGEGSYVNQIICAVLINLPVFAYGMSIGWMSPMSLLLQSKNSPRGTPLSDTEISWMASVPYFVCIGADFLMGAMSDKFGRKKSLFFMSAVCLTCWIIKLSSLDTWAFIVARCLVGILMGGAYVTCPLYVKEISSDRIRGMLGSTVILFHTSGNLFAYIIGDLLAYRTVLWICLALPALHILLFLGMPESPSYLVKKGDLEGAARVIAWLRCRHVEDVVVQNDLNQIKIEQAKDEESNHFALKAILKDKILFRAFRIALAVALAREVCGAIPVANFAGEIFNSASRDKIMFLSPNQQAMMLGAVQVTGALLGSSIVEKTGRKLLLIITSLISGLSMCTLASWFLAKDFDYYAVPWLPILTLCLCIFCDSFGLQPVSVIIISEIFSFKYRGTVMATTMSLSSLFGFLQTLFFKAVTNTLGVYTAFYFFAAVCIFTTIYAILVVPETKRRTVAEIYEDLLTKKEKQKLENLTVDTRM